MESEDLTQAVGPGTLSHSIENPGAMLDGATEYEYVDILNPLTVPFAARFAVTRPVNVPMRVAQTKGLSTSIVDEQAMRIQYGLDLRNPDVQGRAHITNDTVIQPGQVKRFLGNEAQVVVRQLVVEIMSRRGQKLLMADPAARELVEKEIIISQGNVQDVLGRSVSSVQEQLQAAIKDDRYEPGYETAQAEAEVEFAGLNGADDFTDDDGDGVDEVEPAGAPDAVSLPSDAVDRGTSPVRKRRGGRPKKTR